MIAYLATALLLLPAPLFAQVPSQAVPTPVPPAGATMAKNDINKVVCEMEEQIGSRLQAHKVCMTVQQWLQFKQDNREKTEQMQGLTGAPSSGP